jgi:hypothetical protein
MTTGKDKTGLIVSENSYLQANCIPNRIFRTLKVTNFLLFALKVALRRRISGSTPGECSHPPDSGTP